MGTSQGTISKYETGRAEPGARFLKALVREFQVELDGLLFGDGDGQPLTDSEAPAEDEKRYGLGLVDLTGNKAIRVVAPNAFRRKTDRPPSKEIRDLLKEAQEILEADDPDITPTLAQAIRACTAVIKRAKIQPKAGKPRKKGEEGGQR